MASREELERAVAPAREYFAGRVLTTNTVLAARLRAESVPAFGAPWELAKDAVAAGKSFDEAVALAKGSLRPVSEPVGHRGHPSPPRRAAEVTERPFTGNMNWFPKSFGPGDIDGLGAKRLLGTPNLDPTTLLVREMAQNAWDARGVAPSIRFTINLRLLTGEALDVLRRSILTGEAPELGLDDVLARDSIWCLEVSDRGTVGLNGPTRNDLAIDQGVDRNFVDLVFNIGAPRDTHLGGGTYGFGKTISYVISRVGTVLIWSRCRYADGFAERLIGSAMGDAFNMDGRRYTGRHWWGHVVDGGQRIEPVVGVDASRLAHKVFADRFGATETGTSFLILDPDLTGESPQEKIEALRLAVLENLWPKLLGEEDSRSAMEIAIFLDGQPVTMVSPEDDPGLTGYAACLRAVRARQNDPDGRGYTEPFVRVFEIRSERPKRLLGHLAVTRRPLESGQSVEHHVALMRHQAELIVKKQVFKPLDVPGFHWMGVFKPVEEVDDSFAAAEPPAHDEWVPAGVKDRSMASQVRVALNKVREVVDAYLMPPPVEPGQAELTSSVAHVGDLLADMVGAVSGSGPNRRTGSSKQKASPSKRRSALMVEEVVHDRDESSGWDVTTLRLAVNWSGSDEETVELIPKVGVDGASHKDAEAVRIDGWSTGADGPFTAGTLRPETSGTVYFRFRSRPGLAIDVVPRYGAI